MRAALLVLTAVAILLSGCQLTKAAEPAVLSRVDAAVKQQMSDFIIQIVGGTEVPLSDTVLMTEPELFISQRMPLDSRGLPLDGRHALPAYRFYLVMQHGRCILQHPASGKQQTLTTAVCQPYRPSATP